MTKKKAGTKPRRIRTRKASTSSVKESDAADLPQSDSKEKPFTPKTLDKTVIAIPLLTILERDKADPRKLHPVIIDLNLEFPGGREEARNWVIKETEKIIAEIGVNKSPQSAFDLEKNKFSQQYLFAKLEGEVIRELVRRDNDKKSDHQNKTKGASAGHRAIYHIWPDFKVQALINKSISTVKADAAHASFSAFGEGIVWAVMDSGIDSKHPHFQQYQNLILEQPLDHMDFTNTGDAKKDGYGHGTHVAGIIAGGLTASNSNRARKKTIRAFSRYRDEHGNIAYHPLTLDSISGMAPKCKIVSMKVLDDDGNGEVSNIIAAIAKIQEINGYGRRLLIHGVNMSVGYDFEPEWFACGQSPLCVEVNRLVRSGVIVVVAAGNSGYGLMQSQFDNVVHAGIEMTINDPGNADMAITVGSTHRDMPHVYGVSYFSSKGPTGDGRAKPDLVAPGEKILSCAAGKLRTQMKNQVGNCDYMEDSGTSMAAPHVSGVIAAFLSVRREFIGQPENVKQVFLSTATDLKRERYFQGHGLIDMMRAIQSV